MAFAEEGNAVVKMTWVDYDNPTTAIGEIPAGETARAGYNKISGGSVAFANTGWGENKITYIQVDASAFTGVISEATLSIDVSGSSDGKRTTGWGLGYNSSVWSADMTYETADKTITTFGEQQWTSTKSATTFETKTFDIKDVLSNDDDRIVTILVYETAAAGGYVKNPVATVKTVSADQMTTYTVKYVDANGNDIAEPSVRDIVKGETADATEEDLAPKYNEDRTKKYIFISGNTSIEALDDPADNIMTLVFREAETFRYSIAAVNAEGELMQTLTSGSDFEGETLYVPYCKYILNYADSTLYEAAGSGDKGLEFRKTLTLSEDGASINVTYNKSSINNVIYFAEAEDTWGMTTTTAGNALVRSSNAAGGYPAEGDVELTGLATGKYKLTVGFANFKSSSAASYQFALEEDTLFALASTGINLTTVTSDEFTVLGSYVPFKVLQGGNDNQALDFFYIQKTGGVPAVAVANIAEAKKQKNGTPIKLTLNDAKVTVQTYAMMGTFVALEDASGAIQLSSNMALEGITEQNALNGELYVSFVDQNSAMQLDLSDSTQYSKFTATPSTFTPAEIKYSEVKDSANLYRFVKLGACKTIFDEDMYMYYAISGTDTIPVIDRFMNMQTWMGYATEVPEQVEYMTGVVMHNGDEFCFYPYAYGEDKAIVGVVPAEDIVVNVTEGDIAAAVEAAKAEVAKVGNITINLTDGAAYTIANSIVAPASLVINGNGATVDATALDAPFIALSKEPTAELINNYYRVDSVMISNVRVDSIKNSIFYDNGTKYCVVDFTIDNSVLNLATTAVQNEALVSFKQGGAKDFNIKNSTVYGNGVAKYFIRYENGARLDRYGFDKTTEFQTMNYQNNTFYNVIQTGGQWGNYNGIAGQVFSKFDVQNNIWYNCGTNVIRRMAGGRFSGNNPMTFAKNTYFYNDADNSAVEASYDNSGDILTSNPGFKDASNGDFTLDAASEQNINKTGDPRWLVIVKAGSVAYLCGATETNEAIYNALVAADYDVTPLNYDNVTLTEEIVNNDFAGKYDVVVLAGATGSGTNLAKSANLLLGKVNVLSTKSFWYKHYGTNGTNPGSADNPSINMVKTVAAHPIFTGIEGDEFAVFNVMEDRTSGRYLQGNGSFADETLAQTSLGTTNGSDCIGEVWVGEYGYVIIPVDGAQPEGYLTEDGKQLFVNAVKYLVDGVKYEIPTGIDGANATVNVLNGDIYTINGVKVRNAGDSLKGLAKGLYIINGKKLIVK